MFSRKTNIFASYTSAGENSIIEQYIIQCLTCAAKAMKYHHAIFQKNLVYGNILYEFYSCTFSFIFNFIFSMTHSNWNF